MIESLVVNPTTIRSRPLRPLILKDVTFFSTKRLLLVIEIDFALCNYLYTLFSICHSSGKQQFLLLWLVIYCPPLPVEVMVRSSTGPYVQYTTLALVLLPLASRLTCFFLAIVLKTFFCKFEPLTFEV